MSKKKSPRPQPPGRAGWRLGAALGALCLAAAGYWILGRSFPAGLGPGALAGQNLLLVTIDTLRPDRLGAYGSSSGLTPHLDRIAREGVVFENVLSHVPVTLPSHSSIFTGRLPVHHGVHDNGTYRLGPEHETLASRLSAEGYDTAAFVAAFVLDARFGLDRGFELYDDYYGEKRAFESFTELERPAESVLEPAERWLAERREKPWLAWVHLFDPHAPYEAPEPFRSRFRDDPYGAEVAYVDAKLGELLSSLESRGLLERTVVAILSDHGESLGEHGELTHGTFAYNATLSVPWILRAPGLEPGRFEPRVRLVDVAPTLLDLLGVEPGGAVDGTSLRAALGDPGAYEPPDSYFEALNSHLTRDWAPLRGVVRGDVKFIDLPLAELYDLEKDPKELENLVSTRARLPSELKELVETFARGAVADASAAADPETLRRLESLGYVVAPGAAEPKASYSEDDDPKRLIDLVNAHDEAARLFQQGRTGQAIELLGELRSKQPRSSFAHQKLAYALHQTGRTPEAVRVLEEAVSSGIADLSLLALLGSYLLEAGEVERARELLEGLVETHPEFAEAHNFLGVARARSGSFAEAEHAFQRVLELDPSSASACNNLGSLALSQGDSDAAVRYLERALAIDPQSASAWNGLGVAQARSGNLDRAIEAWRRAVELSPAQYDALFNLALALSERSREEARPYLERFASEAPQHLYHDDVQRARAMLRAWASSNN